MRVLVTGAAGFIGKHLITRLSRVAGPHDSIIGLDKISMPQEFNSVKGVTYIRADLEDRESLLAIFKEHKPDIVIHLAAVLADRCEEDPDLCISSNVVGLNNVLKASSISGVSRIVFASSISVYNPQVPEPVKEEYAGNPVTLYGITKYFGELLGFWYFRRTGIGFIALRFPVVFGPGRSSGLSATYSSKIVEDAFKYGKIEVKNPDDTVNYLFVSDAVEALVKAMLKEGRLSGAYNIGGFVSSVRDFVKLVKESLQSIKVEEKPTFKSPWPALFDSSRAEKELGWRPAIDLKRAIEIYIRCLHLNNLYCYLT